MRYFFLIILSVFLGLQNLSAQRKIIDEVVAVVGDKRILYSDIEQTYLQQKAQGEKVDESSKCSILENMLVQKLLLNQSEIDSLEVTDSQVDQELDARMKYFVNAIGSQEKLEEYFKKTTLEIKEDFRDEIRDGLLTGKMRQKITEGLSVTPSEVRAYFKTIPQDSLPYINSEVEYNQILMYPKSNEKSII